MQKSGNKLKNELQDLILANDYSRAITLLYNQQSNEWPQLKQGVDSLSSVQQNKFFFDGYEIYTQFNPGRINSTIADVSPEAVKKSKCLLCKDNLPKEQQGIIYKDKYSILCNPFPIFSNHLTISSIRHTPQRIKTYFTNLLDISRDIQDYCFLYNGPESGASVPGHHHFQACKKESLPINIDYEGLKNEYGKEFINNGVTINAIDDGIRKVFTLESDSSKSLVKIFNVFYSLYAPISKSQVEPMMNIISSFEPETGWRVIIIFREKHRPDAYFKEDDENILVSPATIDLGGVLVTPLEKDFRKIDKETVKRIFREVSMGKEEFEYIKMKLEE